MGWAWLAIAALLALVTGSLLLGAALRDRRHRRQKRLARAFTRAQRIERSGTGEQGMPYSRYNRRVWGD